MITELFINRNLLVITVINNINLQEPNKRIYTKTFKGIENVIVLILITENNNYRFIYLYFPS